MQSLWLKLKRLIPDLNHLSRPLNGIQGKVEDARKHLNEAQVNLAGDRMNPKLMEYAKFWTKQLLHWREIEEIDLRQNAKIDWLRISDGNNAYFHASIKSMKKHNFIGTITKEDGTILFSHDQIEQEVLSFYSNLQDTADNRLQGINIAAMRQRTQLNMEQRDLLIRPFTTQEILFALKGIGYNKTPRLDGYGSRFFKQSWSIMGNGVCCGEGFFS